MTSTHSTGATDRVLYPDVTPDEAAEVVLPHNQETPPDGARPVRMPA